MSRPQISPAPRAAAVKASRRPPHSGAKRPDGGEHGSTLPIPGGSDFRKKALDQDGYSLIGEERDKIGQRILDERPAMGGVGTAHSDEPARCKTETQPRGYQRHRACFAGWMPLARLSGGVWSTHHHLQSVQSMGGGRYLAEGAGNVGSWPGTR